MVTVKVRYTSDRGPETWVIEEGSSAPTEEQVTGIDTMDAETKGGGDARPPETEPSPSAADESGTQPDTSGTVTRGRVTRASSRPERGGEPAASKSPEEDGAADAPPPSPEREKAPPSPSGGKRSAAVPSSPKAKARKAPAAKRSHGQWSDEEKALFERGVVEHGWGNWMGICQTVPGRDR